MRPTVYIETTIPSYYCGTRPELAADIARTKEWWDRERGGYQCFGSAVLIDELSDGQYPGKDGCLALVRDLPLLAVNGGVVDVADAYQRSRVMPGPPVRDALHVALATYYRMDFLLTWNCRHIANANKLRHLDVVNARLGFASPKIVTPDMLLPEDPA